MALPASSPITCRSPEASTKAVTLPEPSPPARAGRGSAEDKDEERARHSPSTSASRDELSTLASIATIAAPWRVKHPGDEPQARIGRESAGCVKRRSPRDGPAPDPHEHEPLVVDPPVAAHRWNRLRGIGSGARGSRARELTRAAAPRPDPS